MNQAPLFHFAESYHDANQFYLSGFLCPDPFALLEVHRGEVVLGVSRMEAERAGLEALAGSEIVSLPLGRGRTIVEVLTDFLRDRGAQTVRVLPSLPLGLARDLTAQGICLEVDGSSLASRRRAKTEAEIRSIETVQRACEEVMSLTRSFLAGCAVRNGTLVHESRDLTAEKIRAFIEISLLERGYESMDTIASPGRGGADPHGRGYGPVRAGVPIVVDIFPRSRETRYHADMSRTFVVGKASQTVKDMHRAVCDAQDAAFSRLAGGVALAVVHGAVCDLLQKRGYGVPRGGRTPRRGLLHGTGHGVGLDVHEPPSVSTAADLFQPGDVVTIEPGLYDRRVGGVRIEDIVVCFPDGTVRNITRFDRDLEIL